MPYQATCTDADFLAGFDGIELLPHAIRLIAGGRPVRPEQIAASAGAPLSDVDRLLRGQVGSEWDEQGRLVGFGLTQRPTAHRLTVGNRTLYTWCAMDTLFFPLILDRRAIAQSRCRATGRPVRIEVSPHELVSVEPAAAVVSHVGACEAQDVRSEVCDHGHFFASAQAAEAWTREHPSGHVLPVVDAFERAARACERLGWLRPEPAGR